MEERDGALVGVRFFLQHGKEDVAFADFGGGKAALQFGFQRRREGVVCVRRRFVEQAQFYQALVADTLQVAFEDVGDGGFLFGGHGFLLYNPARARMVLRWIRAS